MNPTEHLPPFIPATGVFKKPHLMASNPLLSPPLPTSSSSPSSSSHFCPGLVNMDHDHIISILHLLPVESIISFSMTCRRFRCLASSDALWVSICRRDWGAAAVDALLASYTAQESGQALSPKRLYQRVSELNSLSCLRLSGKGGAFPEPRASHSLNLVSGWLILFGGGCEGGRHLDDTWTAYVGNGCNKLLNWKQIGLGVPSGRFGQSCTVAGDSLVLFGGINDNGSRLNDTWVGHVLCEGHLNVRISWRLLDVGPLAPPPRGAHAACGIRDQSIVIHGGIGHNGLRLSDTWILDLSEGLKHGRWRQVVCGRPSPPPRSGHSLTLISDTFMVLFGGRGSGYEVHNDVWIFDIAGAHPEWKEFRYENETFSVPDEMPLSRVGHSATVILGRKVLIYGGEDSQRYRKDDFWTLDAGVLMNFQTMGLQKATRKLWKKLQVEGQCPGYRSFHGACTDGSGRFVYVSGGMVDAVAHPAEANGMRFDRELYQVELVLQL